MVPIRVTPPTAPLVSLEDLKHHLRVDSDNDDGLIKALQEAAVSHLDGWRGIVGRCIQHQVWRVAFASAGCHRLPFPDVREVTVDAGTADLGHDALGSHVTLSMPATVTMTVAAPEEVKHIAVLAVKMLVAHWYQNRESVAGQALSEVPMSVDCLLRPIRWVLL